MEAPRNVVCHSSIGFRDAENPAEDNRGECYDREARSYEESGRGRRRGQNNPGGHARHEEGYLACCGGEPPGYVKDESAESPDEAPGEDIRGNIVKQTTGEQGLQTQSVDEGPFERTYRRLKGVGPTAEVVSANDRLAFQFFKNRISGVQQAMIGHGLRKRPPTDEVLATPLQRFRHFGLENSHHLLCYPRTEKSVLVEGNLPQSVSELVGCVSGSVIDEAPTVALSKSREKLRRERIAISVFPGGGRHQGLRMVVHGLSQGQIFFRCRRILEEKIEKDAFRSGSHTIFNNLGVEVSWPGPFPLSQTLLVQAGEHNRGAASVGSQ